MLLPMVLRPGVGSTMMAKFGGVDRCLKRYLTLSGGDVDGAAAAVKLTIAFREEHSVDTIEESIRSNGTFETVCPMRCGAALTEGRR